MLALFAAKVSEIIAKIHNFATAKKTKRLKSCKALCASLRNKAWTIVRPSIATLT